MFNLTQGEGTNRITQSAEISFDDLRALAFNVEEYAILPDDEQSIDGVEVFYCEVTATQFDDDSSSYNKDGE